MRLLRFTSAPIECGCEFASADSRSLKRGEKGERKRDKKRCSKASMLTRCTSCARREKLVGEFMRVGNVAAAFDECCSVQAVSASVSLQVQRIHKSGRNASVMERLLLNPALKETFKRLAKQAQKSP